MEKYAVVGLGLTALGAVLSALGLLVLRLPEVVAAGLGMVVVGATSLAVGLGISGASNPLPRLEADALKVNVHRLLEELMAVEEKPLFLPSSRASKGPCALIMLSGSEHVGALGNPMPLTDRFIVLSRGMTALRLNPPSVVSEVVGSGLRGGGLPGAEAALTELLALMLNVASGVRVVQDGELVVVSVEGFKGAPLEAKHRLSPLALVVGSIIAEALDAMVVLEGVNAEGDEVRFKLRVMSGG